MVLILRTICANFVFELGKSYTVVSYCHVVSLKVSTTLLDITIAHCCIACFSDGHILGLGSPLLDLSANVTEAFLHKYDLQPNDVIRPGERHRNLCHDMASNFKVELIAGGAVQNTIRVAQWFFHRPRSTVVLGAVGKDNFSQMMRNKAEQDRVLVSYLVDPELPTGTCACLITDQGRSRSLCAYLGASQQFSLQYMLDNIELMHRCRIVYTSGFFLTVCFEAQLMLARHVHSCTDKLFTFNLSAPFIAQRCSHELAQILPYVDILFGNEAETIAIAEAQGWKVSIGIVTRSTIFLAFLFS